MDSVIEFLDMGGYWKFIWPAYGVAALVLGGLLVSTLSTLRRRERILATLDRGRPRRRRQARGMVGVGDDS